RDVRLEVLLLPRAHPGGGLSLAARHRHRLARAAEALGAARGRGAGHLGLPELDAVPAQHLGLRAQLHHRRPDGARQPLLHGPRRAAHRIVLSWLGVWLLIHSASGSKWGRFFVAVMPAFLLLAGHFAALLVERARRLWASSPGQRAPALAAAALTLVLIGGEA